MIHSSDLGLADGFTYTHTGGEKQTFLIQKNGRLGLVCDKAWTLYADVHGMEPVERGEAESFEAARDFVLTRA